MYTPAGIGRDGRVQIQWDGQNRINGDRLRCFLRLRLYHFTVLVPMTEENCNQYMRIFTSDVGRLLVVDFYDNGSIIDYLTK